MSSGLAVITILGTVGRDAETRQAGASTVTDFSVAVNTRRGRDELTTWYRCSIWGTRGEKLAQHIAKGSQVSVSGEFAGREYESSGEKRMSMDVNVHAFAFAGGKRQEGGGGGYDSGPPPGGGGGGGFGDDDIPF